MVSPLPSAAGGWTRTGEVAFLLQGITWLRLRLGFGGKTSSRFVFLLLFIDVPGIGASRRQEMPPLEGRASSTGISGDVLSLGTRCLSRCHRHRGGRERVFIQSPSSSPRRLGLDAAAPARLAASWDRKPGRDTSVRVIPVLRTTALPSAPPGSPPAHRSPRPLHFPGVPRCVRACFRFRAGIGFAAVGCICLSVLSVR